MKKGQPKGYDLVTVTANVDTGIRPEQMEDFKKKVHVGDMMKGFQGKKITITRIYPHFAMTTDGAYQWIDLYMRNVRGLDTTGDGYEFRFQIKS